MAALGIEIRGRKVNTPATGAPTITGTPQVGQTLTAVTTAIMDANGLTTVSYTYQWIRVDGSDSDISGATASTYTLVVADQGTTIKVKVSFTDDASNAETLTSVATAAVSAAANTAPTVATAIPDQSATAGTAFSYAFPDTTFSDADSDTLSYTATKADGTALPTWLSFAASTRTFSGTPQAADTGTVSVKVTASDGNGGSVSDEFDITVSAASNTLATGAPTITGTPQVGQTLTAVTTAIMDADGLTTVSYTYQWIRVDGSDSDISGATASTYTLVVADQGKTIKVKVSFTDDASHSETRTSAATAAVTAAANTPATGAPTITGTAQVGQQLTAVTTGIRDADGLTSVSYTYQWIRVNGSDADISGATSSTYTLVAADEDKTIKVKVSFTDDASHSETRTSAATATVGAAATAPPPPVTDLEQVMGVGVAPGNAQLVVTWTAVDTATGYTVQWKSDGQGYNTGVRQATVASGSTTHYTIPSLTNGTAYTVRVTATRTGAPDGPPSAEMTGTPTGEPEPVPALPLAGAIGLGLLLLGTGGRALRGRARG